jgi:nucleoside-diphosphate-sugar epimerase
MAMKTGVVLGVGGQIGTAVARAMLAAGWRVRGLHRADLPLPDDLRGVATHVGDRNDDASVAAVLADGADGVVDTVAYRAAHGRQLLAHAAGIGALAVISSIAVYSDEHGNSVNYGAPALPVPVPEDHPLVPADDTTYGGGKVALERTLLDANRLPVSLLRPAAVCGPHSRHLREWWFVKRVLDGRPVVALRSGGTSRFHPSSTANLAALALHALGLPTSQALNAADPDCPTVHEIGEQVAAATGHRWRIVDLPDGTEPGPVGDTPWTAPHDLVLDTSRATALGYRPVTTYHDALPALVAAARAEVGDGDWRRVYTALAAYPGDLFDYAAEDELLDEPRFAVPEARHRDCVG